MEGERKREERDREGAFADDRLLGPANEGRILTITESTFVHLYRRPSLLLKDQGKPEERSLDPK